MLHRNYFMARYSTVKIFEKSFREFNITDTIPGLLTPFGKLQNRIKKTEALHWNYKPSAKTKKILRQELAKNFEILGNVVFAYAGMTKNEALKNSIHYSYSDIYRAKENTMMGRCRQILNAVRKVKNPIHYGISEERIAEAKRSYDAFLDFMHTPTANIQKRKRNYRLIDKLLTESLNIIDNELMPFVMIRFKDNQEITLLLKNNRKVSLTVGRKRKYVRKNALVQTTEAPLAQQQHEKTETIPLQPEDKQTVLIT